MKQPAPAPGPPAVDEGAAATRRLDIALVAVLFAALAARIVVAMLPVRFLLTYTFMPDDAFYYADIARNVIAGKGITYDGLAPTNGFHPLHLFLILPLFAVFGKFAAVHAVLVMAAAWDTVTTYLIFRIVRHMTGRRDAALAGAAFFALYPLFMTVTINGLETALSLALIALVFWVYVNWWNAMTPRRAIFFGLLVGLMMLGRTDNVLLFVPLLVALVVYGKGLQRLTLPFVAGLAATAVMAPWLLWNLYRFGSILQVSGKASPWVIRTEFMLTQGVLGASAAAHSFKVFIYHLGGKTLKYTGFGKGALFLFIVALALPRFLLPELRARYRAALGLLIPLGIFILMLVGIHAGLRWFMMAWYFAPVTFASALMLGCVLALAGDVAGKFGKRKTAPGGKPGGRTFIVVATVLLILSAQVFSINRFTVRKAIWHDLAEFVKQETPAGSRIGAFNSGVIGYYSERQTVNLDGVVNNEAYEAMSQGWLDQYIQDVEIDFVADQADYFTRFDMASGGRLRGILEPVARKAISYNPKKPELKTDLLICRVLRPGENSKDR